jgi:hypothetical protein
MTNKYNSTFCEVCGKIGNYSSVEGWATCKEHFKSLKPEFKLFDKVTGKSLNTTATSDLPLFL